MNEPKESELPTVEDVQAIYRLYRDKKPTQPDRCALISAAIFTAFAVAVVGVIIMLLM